MTEFTRRALLSVSDKTGIVEFARGLVERGYALLSTGGTYRTLVAADVPVMEVSQYTGFPEMMDGRVKTLHPKVHGGILARRDVPEHLAAMRAHGIDPIDIVVCNLYPFEQTVARSGVTVDEAIEQIDIGGPSMVRSAAKNHQFVAIVTSPAQYDGVLRAIDEGRFDAAFRRRLAIAAFELTSRYDSAIATYLRSIAEQVEESGTDGDAGNGTRTEVAGAAASDESRAPSEAEAFPGEWKTRWERRQILRYGENPHQPAAWYVEPDAPAASLAAAKQLHGKELSYNNLLDLDAAFLLVREFQQPAAAIVKHNNPCGCAMAETLAEAFDRAYAGDPVSAFGSIIGFNRPVDRQTAERLCEPGRFVEAIIAPSFVEEAFELLTSVPKWHRNVRLLICEG
ncbi:MAG: bifunctional phosphoribosylaminoimidazolecarboxamide formyltransferase/IMP cyclohydrolase PurH, partial [Planctomycetota bacterium]